MRVLHIRDIAGIATILSKEQNRLGYESKVFETYFDKPTKYSEYAPDFSITFKRTESKIEKMFHLFKMIRKEKLYDYNIYHLHFNGSLFITNNFDVPILKGLNKKIVAHYHGDDVRKKGEKFILKHLSDKKFVSTPDLLEYVPDAEWLPSPIELEKFKPNNVKKNSKKITVVQSCTIKWSDKGAQHTYGAVEKLKKEGYDVEFKTLKNIPHKKTVEIIKNADIAVHSVGNYDAAWYGVFACEAMALKKPVCTTIDEKLKCFLPKKIPFADVTEKNLYENLKVLIEDEKLRKDLGEEGRKYVEKYHNSIKIAKHVNKVYGSL